MALQLAERWMWDFWFARDGEDIHVFYLQAPRSLVHEHLRHWNVSIGHAVSRDLTHWEILPDALAPSLHLEGELEPFDSYTTWTGSIVQHDARWWMFYTGAKRSEEGLVQRIGVATSTDLMTWEKSPRNPLFEADPAIYERLDPQSWHDEAWRDPWVFHDPSDNYWHAFITARANDPTIAADARGVIGHARSRDLLAWEILPPITTPGDYGHMEVPQAVEIDGSHYLLFSVGHGQVSRARRARPGEWQQTGTHYLVSRERYRGYHEVEDAFLIGDPIGSLYSARLIEHGGQWYALAFENTLSNGEFSGRLSDPMPITVLPDGRLRRG